MPILPFVILLPVVKSLRQFVQRFVVAAGLVLLMWVGLCPNHATAQKFAYIDSEYILGAVPEYRAAQKQVDVQAQQWQQEIDEKNAEVSRMQAQLQAEQVLLPPDQRAAREKDILTRQAAARDLAKKRFGFEGELFQLRRKLVRPIQDKMFDAVQTLARDRALDFVFDKGSDLVMMYYNPKYDRSDDVIELMGYIVPEGGAPARNVPAPAGTTNPGNPGTGGAGGTGRDGMNPNDPNNPNRGIPSRDGNNNPNNPTDPRNGGNMGGSTDGQNNTGGAGNDGNRNPDR